MRDLREAAVEKMREIVGGEHDPLEFVCALAADPSKDDQLRLSAASIALPFLYPKLSQTQVNAHTTRVTVDAAQVVAQLEARLTRLVPTPVLEAEKAA